MPRVVGLRSDAQGVRSRDQLIIRRPMRSCCRFIVMVSVLFGCAGRGDGSPGARDSTRAGPTSQSPNSDAPVTGKPVCPANGQWSQCAVFERLDHAGLAPRRDSSAGAVALTPLSERGSRLLLGNAQLDVFIFPDESTRQHEEARLDRSQYIEATDEPTLRGEATLIRNANLLAVLRSRNDHQRERVSDALSAGPPQAARGVTPSRPPR
jgi:hypothetical protein